MELAEFINKDLIKILKAETKREALKELIELIRDKAEVENIEELRRLIFHREELMSTGIGLGIAIPHIRVEGVNRPVLVIGLSPEGIPDYESIDNQPVRVIIMIIAGAEQHKEYIKLLARIVSLLKDDELRQNLFKCSNIDGIYNILTKR